MPAGPGRPKGSKNKTPLGFARMVCERTEDGTRLINEAFKILDDPTTKIPDKIEVIKWLADRGFGPAKISIEHSGEINSNAGAAERFTSSLARLAPEGEPERKASKPH